MSFTLQGMGVSRGIAIGPVYILHHQVEITEYRIEEKQLESEIERYRNALKQAREELREIRDQIPLIYPSRDIPSPNDTAIPTTAAEIASFIDPHMLMLDDAMLTQIPVEIIKDTRCNAEWALKQQQDRFTDLFEAMDNEYLKARKHDIQQVIDRVQRCLQKAAQPEEKYDNTPDIPEGSIVLAHDLTPADTALMPHQGIKAFITEHGGMNSHTAIIARSLGIPAIVGLRCARRYLRRGDTLVVDGLHGVVLGNPDVRSLRYFKNLQTEQKRKRSELSRLREAPAVTRDGKMITLYANIEFPTDMQAVKRTGADGIGLYRTEFLHMNRSPEEGQPDENEHYEAYVKVLRAVDGPVTIRTLDLGADKQVDGGIARSGGAVPANPALGLRAVRLCLRDLSLFKPQLRAILRASIVGPVRMMIPMVSSVHEMAQVHHLLCDVKRELEAENLAYDPEMPVGAMVEVPSMAICSDLFIPHVDFFSIGTNDLIQYTLAIDRVDDEVGYLYDPLHPAVLRLLNQVIVQSHQADKPVSMCGEMAGDPRYVRLLLGLGLRYFSVNPETLLEVKHIIRHSDLNKLRPLAKQVLNSQDSHQIEDLVAQMNVL